MSQQNVITIDGDLSGLRAGIREELSGIVDGAALASAVDELYRIAADKAEDAIQGVIDDAYAEFKDDISVPVDYSVTPELRSAVGEFPRYDTGAFSASAQPVVYRAGADKIVGVIRVETPYAGRLNSHSPGGRFYTELTESKWVRRVDTRLTISLR